MYKNPKSDGWNYLRFLSDFPISIYTSLKSYLIYISHLRNLMGDSFHPPDFSFRRELHHGPRY